MTWVKLDDALPEHQKLVDLSDRAFRVHITALCYCNRLLTDGHIKRGALRIVGASPRHVTELVAAGLWDANGAGGWIVHDYLDYQPSKADVEKAHTDKQRAGSAGGKAAAHGKQKG